MTKHDIIEHLTHSCGLQRSSAIRATDGFIEAVTRALSRGENVSLRGLGTIAVVQREERPARHYSTGEPIIIPAHRTVKFKISKELKDTINNGTSV